jgi:ubiquinone/menaquinone biosynthesis C-methylase UbiE
MPHVLNLHRGYSSIESLFYDNMIAPGTLAASLPILDQVSSGTRPGGSVLDVGCGGGQALVSLSHSRPDLQLVGVDPSSALIRRAASRVPAGRRIGLVEASALDLPFADNSFDAVVSLFAIKHWPDQHQGLAECVRVIRPGGRLIVTELDALADRARWRSLVDLTRLPAPLCGAFAAAALGPIVRRLIQADAVRQQLEELRVYGVEVSPDPWLAIVRIDATAANR